MIRNWVPKLVSPLAASALLLAGALALGGQTASQAATQTIQTPGVAAANLAAVQTQAIPNTALPSKVNFAHVSLLPSFWNMYRVWRMPPIGLNNPTQLSLAARSGTIDLSLQEAIRLTLADNLAIATADYERLFAQADLMRTLGGGASRGVTGAVSATTLFSGALGTGIGGSSGFSTGGTGGYSGGGGGSPSVGGGLFDPSISVFSYTEHSVTPLNTSALYGTPISEANTAYTGVNYSQGFATGTALGVSVFGDRQYINSNEVFFNPYVATGFSFNVGQTIFPAGWSTLENKQQIIIAQNDQHVADAVFRQQVIQTVAQTAEDYWDLVRLQKESAIAHQATVYADQLLADTRELVQRGKEPEDDLIQAQSSEATRRQAEIQSDSDALKQATKVKFELARQWNAALITARLVGTEPLPFPSGPPNVSEQAVIQLALRNRPEIEQDRYNLQTKEVAAKVTAIDLRPSLSVGAAYRVSGLSGVELRCATAVFPCPPGEVVAPVPDGLGQAFTQTLHFNNPDYTFGFSLNIPVVNHQGRADQARAQLELAQEQVIVRNDENQLAQQVASDLIDLEAETQKLKEVEDATQLAQQALANAQARYHMGASGTTVMTVITAEDALLDLQNQEIEARASYAKSQIELLKAQGTILSAFHVQLQTSQANATTGDWKIPVLPGAGTTGP